MRLSEQKDQININTLPQSPLNHNQVITPPSKKIENQVYYQKLGKNSNLNKEDSEVKCFDFSKIIQSIQSPESQLLKKSSRNWDNDESQESLKLIRKQQQLKKQQTLMNNKNNKSKLWDSQQKWDNKDQNQQQIVSFFEQQLKVVSIQSICDSQSNQNQYQNKQIKDIEEFQNEKQEKYIEKVVNYQENVKNLFVNKVNSCNDLYKVNQKEIMEQDNWKTEEKKSNIEISFKNEQFESQSQKKQNKHKLMQLPLKRYHKSDLNAYEISSDMKNEDICSKSEKQLNDSTLSTLMSTSQKFNPKTSKILRKKEHIKINKFQIDQDLNEMVQKVADRFIPRRFPKESYDKVQQQYEFEENILRNSNNIKKRKYVMIEGKNMENCFHEEEFQVSDLFILKIKDQIQDQKKFSKLIKQPDQKLIQQKYQNYLAEQCLGGEILNFKSSHENLTCQEIQKSFYQNSKKVQNQNQQKYSDVQIQRNQNIEQINTDFLINQELMFDFFEDQENIQRNTLLSLNINNNLQNQFSSQNYNQSFHQYSTQQLKSCNKVLNVSQQINQKINNYDRLNENPFFYDCSEEKEFEQFNLLTGNEQNSLFQNRVISQSPYKISHAPQLQDDFYLNLLDWSCQNVIAVGLNRSVYIKSNQTSVLKLLTQTQEDDSITSIAWSNRGNHLAVGTDSGKTQIWDVNKAKIVRELEEHDGRISSLAWNGSVISTGSRDSVILNRDLRINNCVTQRYYGHKQEVCGLKWSFDGKQLASGGNDNKLMIWNQFSNKPLVKFNDHKAAVKAIAWSPNQSGLLATGGGTADKCIKFWDTVQLRPISSIDTGSQVCNLLFSKTTNELVSTHGYSQNQIIVWKYPSMKKVITLTGHSYRVLYLAMSPCGQNIVTGAGDETLRFWNVFPKTLQIKNENKPNQCALNLQIR